MATIPVYNASGERTGEVEIDPALLGGRVRPALLKQAVTTYLQHQRQFSARTRSRGMVKGSTRKLYRQKGTGRARMGTVRTNIRRGGGVAFAKLGKQAPVAFPRKMRTLARNNAVLAKIEAQDALIVEGFAPEAPKTRTLAQLLKGVGAERGCVLTTATLDRNVYLSGRNLPKTEVRPLDELNAYEVLRRRKLIFTRPAFDAFVERAKGQSPASDHSAS